MQNNPLLTKRKISIKFGGELATLPSYLFTEIACLEMQSFHGDDADYRFFVPIAYDGKEEIFQAF